MTDEREIGRPLLLRAAAIVAPAAMVLGWISSRLLIEGVPFGVNGPFFLFVVLPFSIVATLIGAPIARISLRRGWTGWVHAVLAGAAMSLLASITFGLGSILISLSEGPDNRYPYTLSDALADLPYEATVSLPFGVQGAVVFWLVLRQSRPSLFNRDRPLSNERAAGVVILTAILLFLLSLFFAHAVD
ncbi:hypothetical protein [Marimonas lutisalis]|uniref:hypothetical protein n=1 Tax=Marimonas lutisalis TaxID=2545756 RepID=UPI0010F4C1D2|nr:hypothetical protein [Marimonas lutisalis]